MTARVKECKVKNKKVINWFQDERMSRTHPDRTLGMTCGSVRKKRQQTKSRIRSRNAILCIASYKKGDRPSLIIATRSHSEQSPRQSRALLKAWDAIIASVVQLTLSQELSHRLIKHVCSQLVQNTLEIGCVSLPLHPRDWGSMMKWAGYLFVNGLVVELTSPICVPSSRR